MTYYNWRQLFKIFGARVVATLDMDGEVRYRFIKKTPFGNACRKIHGQIMMADDGKFPRGYVKRWIEI